MAAEYEKQPARKTHRVVFEVAMDDVEKWEGVLRNVENVQKSLGAKNTRLEVVAHGKGIGLILAKTSAENPDIQAKLKKLHGDGVVFAGCESFRSEAGIGQSHCWCFCTVALVFHRCLLTV